VKLGPVRRKVRAIPRRIREARMFATAMRSGRHPILAHVIPTRRCNLACTYCNEFDDRSPPVPTDEMLRRLDRLAELGTTIITFSGGEPLLHPDLDVLIRRVHDRGIIATLITNGLLLTPQRIKALNRTGLHQLQISIDNVIPDQVSKKSLQVLDRKLQWLAEFAEFDVSINAVVGSGTRDSEDAVVIAKRALELGLGITTGVCHDGSGQLVPLADHDGSVLARIAALRKPLFSFFRYNRFQDNLVRGVPNRWHCRAGSRYLYVCEDGLVHWCSQQRGYPGIPLEKYSFADLEREYHTEKGCAPFCTINCVHQTAILDDLREHPRETVIRLLSPVDAEAKVEDLPAPVRALLWLFVTNPNRGWFSKAAMRLLGVRQRS
jgi:MoaA/NifB/PqqE/SkfB family radical SAM enzyme